jgi:hypothetical protein
MDRAIGTAAAAMRKKIKIKKICASQESIIGTLQPIYRGVS